MDLRHRRWKRAGVLAALLAAASAGAQGADPVDAGTASGAADAGAEAPASAIALFVGKRCGGCHTVGQGDRVGPDLLGLSKRRDKAWIVGFVRTPGAIIDRGDATATKLLEQFKNVRMPDQALTDEELANVLAFLDECSANGGCKLPMGKVRPATEATPADIARGRDLFDGRAALSAGGPPCSSCHNVRGSGLAGGGTLAKDLTFAFARLTDQGLSAGLASTPYPLMKDIFVKKPLTDAEQFAIKAYLWDASRDGTQPSSDHNFFYAGVLGLSLSLGLIGLLWQGRIRGVRQNVIKRGRP